MTAPQRGIIAVSASTLAPVPLKTTNVRLLTKLITHLLLQGFGVVVVTVGTLMSIIGASNCGKYLRVHSCVIIACETAK